MTVGDAAQADDGPEPVRGLAIPAGTPESQRGPPVDVAIAATETNQHAIAVRPSRVGKPLDEPSDGYYSARRGTYRVIYRIDEAKRVVETHSIRHSRDAYRT
jgi:mRNA interferase RelE/StbE